MSQPVTIDGREYPLESLSDDVKAPCVRIVVASTEFLK